MGRILISTFGIVVALGLAGAQTREPVDNQSSKSTALVEPLQAATGKAQTPKLLVPDRIRTPAANVEFPQAAEAEKRANRDLNAQENMAFWAMLMFYAALAGTILSAIGIFLIWRTLLYTRTAAVHSAEMVDEAKKATKAANATVKVTKDVAAIQTRAYLSIKVAALQMVPGLPLQVKMSAQNVGPTPGTNLRVYGGCYTRSATANHPVPPVPQDFQDVGESLLMPEQVMMFDLDSDPINAGDDLRLTAHVVQGITRGKAAIFLHGGVIWEDMFGIICHHRFCMKMFGPNPVDFVSIMPEGNALTFESKTKRRKVRP